MAAPVIILIEPQLGENIGTCARAMLNCGLTELRLVNPRDGWPSDKARSASSGADSVIDGVKLFDSTEAAIADCDLVYATGARLRHLNLPIDTGEDAAVRVCAAARPAILFGPERTGLHNDDVAKCSRFMTIPLNPEFSSLNIAQAVLLISYLWYRQNGMPEVDQSHRMAKTRPATQGEIEGLMEHLTDELDKANFFTSISKRPSMLLNLRAMFARMEPTEQDVLTLRGIVKTLVLGRRSEKRS